MQDKPSQIDSTLKSRYECKYLIKKEFVQPIRDYIAAFTEPDRFAATQPDYTYRISSLYLDNSVLQLYRTTIEGHKNRFKLRVRTYTDDPQDPVFFEVKKRMDSIIRKTRARLSRDQAMEMLRGSFITPENADADSGLREFWELKNKTRSLPLIRVSYHREAYESSGMDPVRITFDTNLSHCISTRGELGFHKSTSDWAVTPVSGTILELKFTDRCPSWVMELIRTFQLQKQSVAKYILCVDRAIELGSCFPGVQSAQANIPSSTPLAENLNMEAGS